MTRKLNVQTPGEAPATTGDTQDANIDQGGVQTPGEVLGTGPSVEELQAQLAALQEENQRLAAEAADSAKKSEEAAERLKAGEKAMDEGARMISRADRAKFQTMHSSQVDAKKLLAPVLCKDGWVAPDQSDQPPRR